MWSVAKEEKQKIVTRRKFDKAVQALGAWTLDRENPEPRVCPVLKPRTNPKEYRILSFDLGIELSLCLLFFTPLEDDRYRLEIPLWVKFRIADADATREQCAELGLQKMVSFFSVKLDVDVVLIEDQPPQNMRTGPLSFALYGHFWTLYSLNATQVRLIQAKEKNIFCHQIGTELKKEHRTGWDQNKELSSAGCTLFLSRLEKQEHPWIARCCLWFANRTVQHDYADCFCQAMAWLTFLSGRWWHIPNEKARIAAQPSFTASKKKRPRKPEDPVVVGRKQAKEHRLLPKGELQEVL